MSTHFFENELYNNLYHSLILFILITIASLLIYSFLKHALKDSLQKSRLQTRIIYLGSIFFVFLLAKIWVQGFTQIFYGLSLVSAGLVITNKETIMNLVGCGIISWRGLFTEGDYIEILGNKGVVFNLGFFYFKLLETSDSDLNRSNGHCIKIPNGLIIHNPVKRISLDHHLIERHITCLIPIHCDLPIVKEQLLKNTSKILENARKMPPRQLRPKKDFNLVLRHVHQAPQIKTVCYFDKPEYIKLTISFHCFAHQIHELDEMIKEMVFGYTKQHYQSLFLENA
jgi:hypothetical protein